ncbi:uncharacterized protein LOC118436850 [Folsomia candida]|uniref:Uncharacterized protein n=1 Tax=Folsomia candida TaxID=158441 RepID=A0A226EWV1_FOLCA|nr:uncharacterized protein LOC118436850 [Folsomia candida]OXA62135.1 hypothetical protein Fcan01_03203 [Folsomia candida]
MPTATLKANSAKTTKSGATKTNPAPSSYKLDSTKTILNGLILTPNFSAYGTEREQPLYDPEESTYEQDFHPPVPHSTATLLSMAEEKIKAMSNTHKNHGRRGNENRAMRPLGKATIGNTTKSLQPNDNNTTSSTQPLKWLREGQAASSKRSLSQTRNSKFAHSPATSNKLRDIFAPDEPDKLITIGGYIINIEKGLPPQMSTSVRPSVSSNERGVEIEVRIKDVDPTKIVVEKRYNSILVISVRESGIKLLKEKLNTADSSLGLEDDVIEVVNIFAPRDVSLTRVMVTPADSKGRLFIKAP